MRSLVVSRAGVGLGSPLGQRARGHEGLCSRCFPSVRNLVSRSVLHLPSLACLAPAVAQGRSSGGMRWAAPSLPLPPSPPLTEHGPT